MSRRGFFVSIFFGVGAKSLNGLPVGSRSKRDLPEGVRFGVVGKAENSSEEGGGREGGRELDRVTG